MGSGHQAGEAIESGSEVIPVMGLSGDGMHRHPNSKRAIHRGPALRCQRPLCIEGRGYGIRSGGEGGLDGIADGFEEHAVVCLDCCPQERVVALDRRRHRRLVLLPERGAALDVGEEEGDGAGGEIGHGASQNAPLDVNPADCRMGVQGSSQRHADLGFQPQPSSDVSGGMMIARPTATMVSRSTPNSPPVGC